MSGHTAKVSVELERPMNEVVDQLLHLAAYPRWNPFVVRVEGAATAKAVSNMAKKLHIDMPITSMIAALITQRITLPQAISALLSRPLKQE